MPPKKDQTDILIEIIDLICNDNKYNSLKNIPEFQSSPNILKKIEINFPGEQEIVRTNFIDLSSDIHTVKKIIENMINTDSLRVLRLISYMKNKFVTAKETLNKRNDHEILQAASANIEVEKYTVFEKMKEDILKEYGYSGAEASTAVYSIILFIFEMCDIGLIPTYEGISPQKRITEKIFDNNGLAYQLPLQFRVY